MPHRPASSDGHTSIFVSFKPYRAALTLVEVCPSLRWPQPRYRRLRFGYLSLRLLPPKDGPEWILPNPKQYGFTLSRPNPANSQYGNSWRLRLPISVAAYEATLAESSQADFPAIASQK